MRPIAIRSFHSACRFPAVGLLLIGWLSSSSVSADEPEIDFNRDIRPIVSGICVACHGPDEAAREAGLRLDIRDGAVEDLGGYAGIVPGDAEASEIIARVTSDDPDIRMPPPGKGLKLNSDEVELLKRWINEGAIYDQHWAYVPPQRSALPEEAKLDWSAGPIDAFVLKKLHQQGLKPSPQADVAALARRVALALTGLPPSSEEVEALVQSTDPMAYEMFVDTQLRKPAFGERWARVWLDLARYADSAGYADDPPREIWAYRDYVIRSLNENKPFDLFTIEQIAGDLLENPSEDQLVATAFHRNTMTNNEGGTNDEQFRNEAIVDRVNTTLAVWMGTTMACAQCHTHKYDPIKHEEYFQIFDFFNQSADADRRDESPLQEVWNSKTLEVRDQLRAELHDYQERLEAITPQSEQAFEAWLNELAKPAQWSVATSLSTAISGTNNKNKLEVGADGWLTLGGERPEKAVYELRIPTSDTQHITGVRLEVSDQQATNFVLSRATAWWESERDDSPQARFVRIVVPGKERYLHVAEVQVFSDGKNIASGGTATQSSTTFGADASRAVDGINDGDFQKGGVTHTALEASPWLEIDLGQMSTVDNVVVWNRTDGGKTIADRIDRFTVEILDQDKRLVASREALPAKEISRIDFTSRDLGFESAIADFAQDGFPASAVLSDVTPSGYGEAVELPPADESVGWAIAPKIGARHELTLLPASSFLVNQGQLLLRLEQTSKFTQHVLTNFRILLTEDPRASLWAGMSEDVKRWVVNQSEDVSLKQKAELHFRETSPWFADLRGKIARTEAQLAKLKPETSVPMMKDLPEEKHRETFVQIRGNYLSLGTQVKAEVPDIFHPLGEDQPRNRLGLARWLVDKQNPLTARVIVNRHWEEIFGIGIVATSEEFGTQGDLPTHPELLDWLAIDLMESGWDIKALLKQLVMSSTYRQSSGVTPELLDFDPDNRWNARGPRFRISAEMVRDQTLAVAGLLSDKMYGPPVRPPQPNMGLTAAFGSATDWQTSPGEDRFRRGIYTTWRRSNPYPSMATFDAPNREVCTLRRSRTNTPLQALVTMNDPVYVEAAQSLARRMASFESTEQSLAAGVRMALLREPSDEELKRLTAHYQTLAEHYAQDPEGAMMMATDPLGPLPEGMEAERLAAMTVIANVLLNLDEFLMPR